MTIRGSAFLDSPLEGPDRVLSFGPTLVVAPHPDDESLGCGGAIALLRDRDIPVRVVVVSDGTGSHPNSRKYGPEALRTLRETEAVAALVVLGVHADDVWFLRLPDTRTSARGDVAFEDAVSQLALSLPRRPSPETILLPWRRDPHSDHRATWDIVTAAVARLRITPRVLEYPIWLWDNGTSTDAPMSGEVRAWRLDIGAVLGRKLQAIAAHRSQTTDLIDDDPDGFRLTAETLEHFRRPWELFLEPCP